MCTFWAPHPDYLALGTFKVQRLKAYQALFQTELTAEQETLIRHSVNKGIALGNDRFRMEIERLTGIRQLHAKRGRKPKKTKRDTDTHALPLK